MIKKIIKRAKYRFNKFIIHVFKMGLPNVTLVHPIGHPYWQANKFRVIFNGEEIDTDIFAKYDEVNRCFTHSEYEIHVGENGIYVQYFHCSSGSGKVAISERYLLLHKSSYGSIVYKGEPLLKPAGAFY